MDVVVNQLVYSSTCQLNKQLVYSSTCHLYIITADCAGTVTRLPSTVPMPLMSAFPSEHTTVYVPNDNK